MSHPGQGKFLSKEMHETPAARNDIDGTLPKHKMQDVSQAELRDARRKQVMVIL